MANRLAASLACLLVVSGLTSCSSGAGASDGELSPPRIEVAPSQVNFEQVMVGELAEFEILISNAAGGGSADLIVKGFELIPASSGQWFTVFRNGKEYGIGDQGPDGALFLTPIVLAPSQQRGLTVRFRPVKVEPADAALRLRSNDSQQPELVVQLAGEGIPAPECLLALPNPVQFGGTRVGTVAQQSFELSACDDDGAEVTGIALDASTSQEFQLDLSSLDHVPSPEAPIALPAGGKLEVTVTYTPEDVSPIDSSGDVIPDRGGLLVETVGSQKHAVLKIWGAGVDSDCPSAIIRIEKDESGEEVGDGQVVSSPTLLQLSGTGSFANAGTVGQWEWSVEQPWTSPSAFAPDGASPEPTFEAVVPGAYTFRLTVKDEAGVPSCFPAKRRVLVRTPGSGGIEVELTWHTPGDPDEYDTGEGKGSDLDLHFLHPWAAGPDLDGDGNPDGWFDIPFDAFWFNAHPNWGNYDPSVGDDPSMEVDDADGQGPEIIKMDQPDDVKYRIGVHYWNDFGYGPAYATVRVYLEGQLAFEAADVLLVDWDMWDVATIDWPSRKVHPVTDWTGKQKITPNYQNPYFFQ